MMPLKFLQLRGHEVKACHITEINFSEVPEVVLVERVITPELVEMLRLAGAKRIVVTFDDHYGLVPTSTTSHSYWKKGEKRSLPPFRRALRLVDLAVVPSRNLVSDFNGATQGRIEYLPNFLDPDLWKDLPSRESDKIVIGWGGSLGHIETWRTSKLPQALKFITDEFGEKVEILSCGSVADEFLAWANVPFKSQEWVKFTDWPKTVARFDIGLAPMDRKYDTFRSNLKLLEYGMASAAYAASYEGAYVTDGSPGGVLVEKNTVSDWYNAIRDLIVDTDTRKRLGQLGRTWAEGYLMPDHVEDYEKVLWPN